MIASQFTNQASSLFPFYSVGGKLLWASSGLIMEEGYLIAHVLLQMHATFVLKCGKCRLHMKQCNVMESLYNVHDILSLFCDFDFDLIFLENTD